jgi:hypothetical protein
MTKKTLTMGAFQVKVETLRGSLTLFWPAASSQRPVALNSVVAAADFHKMAFFVQTGNLKSMDGREFPPIRQLAELFFGIAPLHGEQSPATHAQMPGPAHELRNRTHSTRQYDVETRVRSKRFCACVNRLNVGELQQLTHMIDELELFRGGIDECELPFRIHDRKRNTGKSRTGSYIADVLTL